jgi:hypothetical protein
MFSELEFARLYGLPQQSPDNQGRDANPAKDHKRCEQHFQNIPKSDRIAEEFRFLCLWFPKHHVINPRARGDVTDLHLLLSLFCFC